jgi:putative tryptophan/tyrosine transport system substrate-binding protein
MARWIFPAADRREIRASARHGPQRVGKRRLRWWVAIDSNVAKGIAAGRERDRQQALKVDLRPIQVRGPDDLESAISAVADQGIAGLEAANQPMFTSRAGQIAIAAVAAKFRLPSIGSLGFARNGVFWATASASPTCIAAPPVFVDRILDGAKPGAIPVEQATKFTTVVNPKTAKAIGVEIPPLLLASADEVIE